VFASPKSSEPVYHGSANGCSNTVKPQFYTFVGTT